MSTRTIVELIDDVDGTPAVETVKYSLDGTHYEIDLSEKNAQALRSVQDVWINYSRKVPTPTPSAPRASRRNGKDYDPAKVREWARSQGIQVSDRGRLDRGIIAAYKAGHAS